MCRLLCVVLCLFRGIWSLALCAFVFGLALVAWCLGACCLVVVFRSLLFVCFVLLVVGCWLLVGVSCWLLVVSCWLLVVDCWLLVV